MLTQLQDKVQLVLNEISDDSSRKWGVMGPQHMVEHLASVFEFSTGKFGVPFSGDEEKAAKGKAHFFSTAYPFPRRVPLQSQDPPSPPELKSENMEAAKVMMKQSVQEFMDHYQGHPEQENPHPFMNTFTYPEWLEFHVKHLDHHLMQFSVIAEPEEVV
ncbi:MAG: DUF1569 domain-containing protein [Bacteroidia bacterium]|nr:DUF1569 domain-containing protein [Bacteroidia bacterium]